MFNRSFWWILIAALAAGLGLYAGQRYFMGGAEHTAAMKAQPVMQTVRLFPQSRGIAPFSLQQSDGTVFDSNELKGRWTLIFLGFTHCPDVCPTTLTELSQAQKTWEALPEGQRPRIVFVSVDPERDTPKITGDYAAYFHKETIAVTADIATLEAFTKSLAMVFAKQPLESGDYTMDHSATISVHDPSGNQVGIISPPLEPKKIAADLIELSTTNR
jgi:protein SCO1